MPFRPWSGRRWEYHPEFYPPPELFLDSIIDSPMAMDFTELLPVMGYDQTLADDGAEVATETIALSKFIINYSRYNFRFYFQ